MPVSLCLNCSSLCFQQELKQKKREEFRHIAVFPCKLRVLAQHIFNTRDPIVVGVSVEGGVVKEGMPVTVPSQNVSINDLRVNCEMYELRMVSPKFDCNNANRNSTDNVIM